MSNEFSIDIRPLKRYALEKQPNGSDLRKLLLGENDWVPAALFLGRIKVWLDLLKIEESRALGRNS